MSTEGIAQVTQARTFTKTPEWLDFCAHPTRPRFKLPDGAVDAHCHVFGPGAQFPYAPTRKYTPCDAPKDKLFALRDYLGFSRNVIVQASCHGTDNRALVDALTTAGDLARGIAVVAPDVARRELDRLHAVGVRGVRFNFLRRLADAAPLSGFLRLADKIAALGWHVVVYFEAKDLPRLEDFLASLPVPIVVDHMGRPDVSKAVDGPEFGNFLRFMREHENTWCKLSGSERLTQSGPFAVDGELRPYSDVAPFAKRLMDSFPHRVLWGTDWPHPNLKSHMPDDGLLVSNLANIVPGEYARQLLLVDNPTQLYWAR